MNATFDQIVDKATEVLQRHKDNGVMGTLEWLVVNRDLNGRVRLIAPEPSVKETTPQNSIQNLYADLSKQLEPHSHPVSHGVIYAESVEQAKRGASCYALPGFTNVWVADRLVTESNWSDIEPIKPDATPRIVFFSIKGGVGRSTALAATAWSLAQSGRRVLVLDLDLESPGLAGTLLPSDRQPQYGITDWLVEDLVNNGEAVFDHMVASSNLSHDGEILVVPAHGQQYGEYLAKLGRVWMPKVNEAGTREPWSARLRRLLDQLENRTQPDVVLIDSRSGLDELASACISDLGASLLLLFAIDGDQTWNGYRMLFEQWQCAQVADKIRDRLQVVGALVPETHRQEYLDGLCESAYNTFSETLYDDVAPANPTDIGTGANSTQQVGEQSGDEWNFEATDTDAPHFPWPVLWHRGFHGQRSLNGRLPSIGPAEVEAVFGPLITGVNHFITVAKT